MTVHVNMKTHTQTHTHISGISVERVTREHEEYNVRGQRGESCYQEKRNVCWESFVDRERERDFSLLGNLCETKLLQTPGERRVQAKTDK